MKLIQKKEYLDPTGKPNALSLRPVWDGTLNSMTGNISGHTIALEANNYCSSTPTRVADGKVNLFTTLASNLARSCRRNHANLLWKKLFTTLDSKGLPCYIYTMITNDASNNTTAKNIFLASGEPTLKQAQRVFRKLQREAGAGTTESDFARLEEAWEADQELGGQIM